MPYNPTNWVNGETQFNEDNMNKIEQAMGNRQLDTFTTLAQIGLTDNDIDALTKSEPKKEYFYFSPKGKQVFDLCLCENELNILKEKIA